MSRIQTDIEKRAAWVVDRILGKQTIDFVAEVSQQLPMHTFCDMFGVPDELREDVRAAASKSRWGSFCAGLRR